MREKLTLGGYIVITVIMMMMFPFLPLALADMHRNGGVINGLKREFASITAGEYDNSV